MYHYGGPLWPENNKDLLCLGNGTVAKPGFIPSWQGRGDRHLQVFSTDVIPLIVVMHYEIQMTL